MAINSIKSVLVVVLITGYCACMSQSWVDSIDHYARTAYLPANKYAWRWTHAALLNTMMKQYEWCATEQKPIYLDYVKMAMNRTYHWANGKTPNSVASAMGLAFLYRVTNETRYKEKADKVYTDYLKIRRTENGGVSHLMLFTELWDDTVFMIGEFLLQMYAATGEEKYVDELVAQIRIHREKLLNDNYGLWVHGWDSDNKKHCTFCSQMNWADSETRKSAEMWGRGNGWIVVTLSDALETLPRSHANWNELAGYLKEMVVHLPEWQDAKTGHWYQLPVRAQEPGNWIESSSTAMFAYGIHAALQYGLVHDTSYVTAVERAYTGLRAHSVVSKGKYLTASNVCTGTCIGDKYYYYKRKSTTGSAYGLGMFVQFGRKYNTLR